MITKISARAVLATLSVLWLAAPLQAVIIEVGSVQVAPGGSGTFDVVLRNEGSQVAGTDNRINFDRTTPIVDCEVNPAIRKESTVFPFEPFLPPGCDPGVNCTGCTPGVDCDNVRALVLSLSLPRPINNNARLYTCTVDVPAGTAEGAYELSAFDCESSDPDGVALATTCTSGEVIVTQAPAPTATATPDTHSGGGGGDCHITSPELASPAWHLFGLAALLVALRRRGLRRSA